ncbi:MAG: 50S ribosome-binding GTPase [Actinomycetota bacterium]|nr:50S ribosome-binding GTPase [Actinomycetota bacterium]
MARTCQIADLHTLGDTLDVCLARSEGVIQPDAWNEIAALRGRLRRRTGFLDEVLVVALAGGTGSGKSSLLNALCGTQVATVGIERPTTSTSLAAVPKNLEGDVRGFVQALGIETIVTVESLERIVFVDLPDFDSTFTDHRLIVESVLSVVDAVVWVLDPEKYADRLVHESFLTPLKRYGDQMIFVLNQVDRIADYEVDVVESLRAQLHANGYQDPQIVTTVAAANEGTDLSTEALESALASRLDLKHSAVAKLAVDVKIEANRRWHELDVEFVNLEGQERIDSAVAMASFVSLGVAAYEVAASISGGNQP